MITPEILYEALLTLPMTFEQLGKVVDYGEVSDCQSVYSDLAIDVVGINANPPANNRDFIIVRNVTVTDVLAGDVFSTLKDGGYVLFLYEFQNSKDLNIINVFRNQGFKIIEKIDKESLSIFLLHKHIAEHEDASIGDKLLEIKKREEERLSTFTNNIVPALCNRLTWKCEIDLSQTGARMPICCQNHLKEMLFYITDLLDSKGIRYWIDYELLLWAKLNGTIQIQKKTATIGVFQEDYEKIIDLRGKVILAGYRLEEEMYRRIKYISMQYSKQNSISIDLMPWRKNEKKGIMERTARDLSELFNASHVQDLEEVVIEGRKLKCPSNADRLLALRYGQSWKVVTPVAFNEQNLILPEQDSETYDSIPDDLKHVWVYWENKTERIMPPIFEQCISTVMKNSPSFKVHVITDCNVRYFIPDLRKDFEEIANPKHKGDYIRAKLLHTQGGVWCDSDMILRKNMLEVIDPLRKFDFVGYGMQYGMPILGFFAARKECELLGMWLEKLDAILNRNMSSEVRSLYFDESLLELANNYRYYNYDGLMFEPIPLKQLSFYMDKTEAMNSFCNEMDAQKKIIACHLHSDITNVLRKQTVDEIMNSGTLVSKILKKTLGE